MSSYDDLLDAGRTPLECPVCTGNDESDPCSDECAEIVFAAARKRSVARLYASCRAALVLARRYRIEEGRPGVRERAAIEQIGACRQSIRVLRALNEPDVDTVIDVALAGDMEAAAQ